LFAISFITGELWVFCTLLSQRGGHFARIGRIGENNLPDVRAKFHAPPIATQGIETRKARASGTGAIEKASPEEGCLSDGRSWPIRLRLLRMCRFTITAARCMIRT